MPPKKLKGNGREGARNGRSLLDRATQFVHEMTGGTGQAPSFGIGEGAAKALLTPGGGTVAGVKIANEAVKQATKKRKPKR